MRSFLAILFLGSFVSGAGASERVTLTSGPSQVALVELYTSEGCSSCPPAEQWLGSLRSEKGLWTRFVPVAFHVDYWNRLGWRDRFSTKEFTAREYTYANAWRSENVYTPCFVLNGHEWRDRSTLNAPGEINAGLLRLVWDGAGNAVVAYQPPAGRTDKRFEVNVALLGGGIESKVTRGENGGRTLEHDFIALRLVQNQPLVPGTGGNSTYDARVTGLVRPEIATKRTALVAWVTTRGSQAALQSVGGWVE